MPSTRTIDWDLIRQQYDQIVKYTTALRLGTAEVEQVLRRFAASHVTSRRRRPR
ncbi:Tn3 family transposase [Streptomyces sp. NPDC056653]|uniref:Tn3 family transposase n=1 Tax=Streptomyces sp. NPDC056653 TaxID=3345894 RepID=UPI0036A7FFD4